MKATDLMIGDWVLCDRNAQSDYEFDNVDYQPYKIANGEDIDYAFEQNMIGDADADVYQPIPLTAEILEKNQSTTSQIQYRWDDFLSRSFGEDFYEIRYHGDVTELVISIRYVHELQHALRLCGIEKEISI